MQYVSNPIKLKLVKCGVSISDSLSAPSTCTDIVNTVSNTVTGCNITSINNSIGVTRAGSRPSACVCVGYGVGL